MLQLHKTWMEIVFKITTYLLILSPMHKTDSCLDDVDITILGTAHNGSNVFKTVCMTPRSESERQSAQVNPPTADDHTEKLNCSDREIQTVSVMFQLADRMTWRDVVIITDNNTEETLSNQLQWEQMPLRRQLVLNIDLMQSHDVFQILLQQHRHSLRHNVFLNVLVICSSSARRQAIQIITEGKKSLRRFSAFEMKSLWLVAMGDTETDLVMEWTSGVQNVAFVVSTLLTRRFTKTSSILFNVSRDICDGKSRGMVENIPTESDALTTELFPSTLYGMNNRTLIVSTLPFHNYVMRSERNGKRIYTGLCISILDFLAQSLNFSYIIGEPRDGKWGKDKGNGSYNGMVSEIMNEEIDLIVAPIIPQVDRINKMDFTIPYSWDRVVVVFQKPPLQSTKWLTLVNPFDVEVFVCIGVSMVFIVCFLVFVEWNNPYYSPEARQVCTIWRIFRHFTWYAYGSLIKHGGIHLPDSASGRLTIGFWLLFCTIISAAYSANLIAFLTVNIENLKFHSVEDLLNDDAFQWGSTGNYPFTTLKNGEDERLWDRIEEKREHKWVDENIANHLTKLQNGSYVFVNLYVILSAWASTNCNLRVIVPKLSVPLTYTFGLPFDCDFTTLFSERIMELIDSAMLDAVVTRLTKNVNSNTCGQAAHTKARTVDLEDLQSAFYMLTVGLVLSVLAVLAEILYKAVNGRQTRITRSSRRPGKLIRFF